MAKGWKCARCGTENPETQLTCSNCQLIRGAVFVPTNQPPTPSWPAQETAPAPPEAPGAAQPTLTGPDQPAASAWAAGPVSQPQPGGSSVLRSIPLRLILFVLVIGATAIGGWFFGAGRGDTGEITKPGDLQAADLRVGDCFDVKDPDAETLFDVTAKPCDQAHEFEMFFVGSLPEGAYPPEATFDSYVEANCLPSFATYVGKSYQESALDIYWLVPTSDAWGEGDRSVQCAVYAPNDNQLVVSLKGSGY